MVKDLRVGSGMPFDDRHRRLLAVEVDIPTPGYIRIIFKDDFSTVEPRHTFHESLVHRHWYTRCIYHLGITGDYQYPSDLMLL